MSTITHFEEIQVRRVWNAVERKWRFPVDDAVVALTETVNVKDSTKKLRKRDPALDSYWGTNCPPVAMPGADGKGGVPRQTVTICHGLKRPPADGEPRLTDVADTEQLLRLIQSISAPA